MIYSDAGIRETIIKSMQMDIVWTRLTVLQNLGKKISVDWKPLELTQNDSVQDDTSSDENVMSAEEVYQKLEEHYAQGTIDSREKILRSWKEV